MMEMDVGSADLGEQDVQQGRTGLERRTGELDDADRLVRRRDGGGKNGRRSRHLDV